MFDLQSALYIYVFVSKLVYTINWKTLDMVIKNYGIEVEEIEIDKDLLYLAYLFTLIKINISKLNKRVDRYM